jgi:hypothetical protein
MPVEELNARRTPEQRSEDSRKAGIASGIARRQRKTRAELAKMIAENPASAKDRKKLEALGLYDEDATNDAVIVGAVFGQAKRGD